MRQKSIKKHIKVGSIIKLENCDTLYEVTELKESLFVCKIITDENEWKGFEQEFYYNVKMKVYNFVDSNYL